MPIDQPVLARDLDEIINRDLPWENWFGRTVLITGAGGMIPSYLLATLLHLNDRRDAGIRVLGMVRSADRARAGLAELITGPDGAPRGDVALIENDVVRPYQPTERIDLVVHAASAARPALHAADPVGTIRANLTGTFNLLDMCVAHDIGQFALTSSAEVYGARPAGTAPGLLTEDDYGRVDITNPRACYSEGKRAAETIAVSYAAQYGITATIGRFGHIYGPRMALDDGRVQADFAADVIAGRDITLNSDGSATRTYTYLADAVAGMCYALLTGTAPAYNIADPAGLISIRELAEAFVAARPDKHLALRFADGVDISAYNPTRAQGLDAGRLMTLGWQPLVRLADGLDRTLAWHEARLRPAR